MTPSQVKTLKRTQDFIDKKVKDGNIRIPSFRIHKADKTVVETLKNSFIQRMQLSIFSPNYLRLPDGTEWLLVFDDNNTKDALLSQGPQECIVSFQAHTYGNFAIAKLFNPIKPVRTKG